MKYTLSSIIRNIKRNRLNVIVMILGLSISFALVIYITGYVYSELSYDQFIRDKDRIYRIYGEGVIHGRALNMAVTSPDFAVSIKNEIPEIEETVRIMNFGIQQIKVNDNIVNDIPIIRSDKNFFSFFGFKLLAQSQKFPLENRSNIVISEKLAKKYFGSVEKALGKNIKVYVGNKLPEYTIAGVFKDISKNFHLNFQIVQSVYINRNFNPGTFEGEYIYTYIKTKNSNIDIDALNLKLTQYQYYNAYNIHNAYELTIADCKSHDPYILVKTEPLKDIHFCNHKFDIAKTSNKTYVIGAIILSLLVVIISFINFFNLSVASLSKRLRNFGIKRTIGANKRDILNSLTNETLSYFVLSFCVAIGIYYLFEKPFSQFTGFEIKLNPGFHFKLVFATGVFLLIFILLSNLFSYFFITRHSSQELIKISNQNNINRFGNLRNLFLVIQFSLSSLVIISTLIINKQIQFFAKADKGFKSENILTFVLDQKYYNNLEAFVEELKTCPFIRTVGTSTRPIGRDPSMNAMYFNSVTNENYFHSSYFTIDDDFPETYNFELTAGRFFDNKISTDFNEVIINETAAKEYMLDGYILNDYIIMENDPNIKLKIVGIVKDFNFRTLHHPVEPLILKRGKAMRNVSLKINNDQISDAINFISTIRAKYSMDNNFEYSFVDERLANNYFKETQFRKLLTFITIIAIFISCLGLFAISQLTIIQKTKEVAIRKINGARIVNIASSLVNNFVKWIVFAIIITTPIAWYLLNKWLENFSYRTDLNWWLFAIAGLIAISVAILTVFMQIWRAARRNPVEALRYE